VNGVVQIPVMVDDIPLPLSAETQYLLTMLAAIDELITPLIIAKRDIRAELSERAARETRAEAAS
jgi:hypothetical protein